MTALNQTVIVGGGLAGANAAFELRKLGYDGRLTIVGEEDAWPYERPPMSKAYLRGEEPIDKAYVRPPADYEANAVELLRGTRATAIDLARHRLSTTAGEIPFDALVIATGATPRRLDVPGAELDGVLYLRDVADADALRSAAEAAESIAVIGGGWIGAEVAASLRQLGHSVAMITSQTRPLEHVLGPEIAEVYRQVHVEHGVRLVSGRVEALEGSHRVAGVLVADGHRVAADLVVVGVGALPRIDLAAGAGLRLEGDAILVDQFLRTSAPGIYAVGDAATAFSPRYGRAVHLEHWDNAIRQGQTVAANILGSEVPYDRVPYLYSDQYDLGMEYRGLALDWDEVVVRGDLRARHFHAFWLNDGRVSAAMNVNLWDDGDALQELVESEATVDRVRLADSNVALAEAA